MFYFTKHNFNVPKEYSVEQYITKTQMIECIFVLTL